MRQGRRVLFAAIACFCHLIALAHGLAPGAQVPSFCVTLISNSKWCYDGKGPILLAAYREEDAFSRASFTEGSIKVRAHMMWSAVRWHHSFERALALTVVHHAPRGHPEALLTLMLMQCPCLPYHRTSWASRPWKPPICSPRGASHLNVHSPIWSASAKAFTGRWPP